MGDNLDFSILKAAGFVDRYEKDVTVMQVTGGPSNAAAFVYQCVLNKDVDGAATTYGLNNPKGENTLKDASLQAGLKPLDHLGNACGDPGDGTKGYKNWEAGSRNFYWSSLVSIQKKFASKTLVIDERASLEAGRAQAMDDPDKPTPMLKEGDGYYPVIQTSGPAKGYYISTTATYTEGTLADTNPAKWVDGSTVPYVVWAKKWLKHKIGGKNIFLGDFGLAINNVTGQYGAFFFGDAGTPNKVGESSGKLYETLGNSDAQLITFIVFPGSGSGKEVGKDPQNVVGIKVWLNMLKFCSAKNALDLPMRLAFPGFEIPKKQAEMTITQAKTYQNIVGALRFWGIWPK